MHQTFDIVSLAKQYLPASEVDVIREYYENNEFGLPLLQTVDRLSDLEIEVGSEYATEIGGIALKLSLPADRWAFVFELVSDNQRPFALDAPGTSDAQINKLPEKMNDLSLTIVEQIQVLKENDFDEVMIVRFLRERHRLPFDEAVRITKDGR